MERKKDQKIASSSNLQSDTNDILRKEEPNVAANGTGATSPANGIAPSSIHQSTPIFQWQYPTQPSMEQPFASSGPRFPTHSQLPFAISQWHQSPSFLLNPNGHQSPPPPHLSQSATPFWLLQRPGYHYPGLNSPPVFQPVTPLGTTGVSWQVPGPVGGGVALKEHHLVPNMCYPYPAFPGPWDPSSYLAEGYNDSSLQPPTMPGRTTSLGQPVEKGVIRTPAKLSQKHQLLWEAQSAENVQLWTVIGQMKSEIADYKSQIMKLETEISSLKQLVEEPTANVTRTNVSRKASKRGRLKRSVASVDVADDYKPRTRGRRPASKAQMENKSSDPVKVQFKEKTCEATATAQREGIIANNGTKEGDNQNGGNLPSCYSQVLQQLPKSKISAVVLTSPTGVKSRKAKYDNLNNPFAVLSQQAKVIVAKGSMAGVSEPQNGDRIAWSAAMRSVDSETNVQNTISQGFYSSNADITQSGKMVSRWSFANEEDASDDLEDAGAGSSGKEGNEEIAEDGSSDAEEEIARAQAGSLPEFNDWP